MILLDGGTVQVKPPRKRLRKVFYGYYDHEWGSPHPVICIRGKHLRGFGFDVGDTIEVRLEQNHITIVKIEASRRHSVGT